MLRKPNGNKANYGIRFDDDSFKSLVPTLRHRLDVRDEGGTTILQREGRKQTLTSAERDLFQRLDGKRTIEAIAARNGGTTTEHLEATRQFFRRMWRLGHMNFQRPRQRPSAVAQIVRDMAGMIAKAV